MDLNKVIEELKLEVLTTPKDFSSTTPTSGYVSDLLSCVMAGAKSDNIWITLQSHINIVAVAALTEVCAVIITENARPEASVIERANEQGVTLLLTAESNYKIVGKLWEMGVR
jgi:hypothetical protein